MGRLSRVFGPGAGTALQWSSPLRLRHCNTGRYLCAARPPMSGVAALAGGGTGGGGNTRRLSDVSGLHVSTVAHPTLECAFSFEPTTIGSLGGVPASAGVRIQVRARARTCSACTAIFAVITLLNSVCLVWRLCSVCGSLIGGVHACLDACPRVLPASI